MRNERLGVGVIGVGTYGEWHARAYHEHTTTELVGVSDINEELGREVAGKYGNVDYYADYQDLLERADLEAVSIVLPDFLHRECCEAAAEAGKHILVEKPLATTVEDASAIVEAADRAGVSLAVDFANRWGPGFAEAKRVIERGELGDIEYINMFLNDTIFVPTEMLSWAGDSSVAWFLGSHCVDLVRWLSQAEISKVRAHAGYGKLTEQGIDTADYYKSTLELENGALAHIENCWILPESTASVYDFRAEIVGTEGKFEVNASPNSHRMACKYAEDSCTCAETGVFIEIGGKLAGFGKEVITTGFVDRIMVDQEPFASGQDGLTATKIVCAIEEAAESGSEIVIN
ncbi:MAG: Gfo/Idh/MocA family protein [Candidatus Bipolaricaulota bacterium]